MDHDLPHLPHSAEVRRRTIPHQIFFIAFLEELDNFKHFEPYLFFGQFLVKSAAECDRTVRAGAGVRKWVVG